MSPRATRRGERKRLLASVSWVGILVSALMALTVSAQAGIDRSRVYYGNPDSFSSPGEIVMSAVFAAIPEYQKIKEEKIPKRDARWWLLMSQANARFQKALKSTSEKYGYDLIAECGCVGTFKGKPVPDITGEVMGEL